MIEMWRQFLTWRERRQMERLREHEERCGYLEAEMEHLDRWKRQCRERGRLRWERERDAYLRDGPRLDAKG